MKRKIRKCICILSAAALLSGGMQEMVRAENVDLFMGQEDIQSSAAYKAVERSAATVSTREQFMAALQQHKSPITVAGQFSIGDEADPDGRMRPVMIPAGTVISGNGTGSISCRSPIQLEGDDVRFENIELVFNSSNALGSVPHREIFLAGHSLTFDRVSTWLKGGADSGGMGGTEAELLPTVYAGGYTGTAVGGNASLTVQNSVSDKTVFQAVYMGHDPGADQNVPYHGPAAISLDTKVSVRERVDVSKNSLAEILVAGGENEYPKTKRYYGNANTTFTLSGSIMDGAEVEKIGSIVLKDKACLTTTTSAFGNVTLLRGGCLDIRGEGNAIVSGDFSGTDSAQERGNLVLHEEGTLTIHGNVTGTTQFQTKSRLFPGKYNMTRPYITANGNVSGSNFVLAQRSIDSGYRLDYRLGAWSVSSGAVPPETLQIGGIDLVRAPSDVSLEKIKWKADASVPDENTYFEIRWTDTAGNPVSSETVEEQMLYAADYVFVIKSEYWESDAPEVQQKTDWGNPISLVTSDQYPGKYFLEAEEGAKAGAYTFLFSSEYYVDPMDTVQDVKDIRDTVKAEHRVVFSDGGAPEVVPPVPPEETPDPAPVPPGEPSVPPAGTPDPAPVPPGGPSVPPAGTPDPVPVPPGQLPGGEGGHVHEYRTVVIPATPDADGKRLEECSCGDLAKQQTIYRPAKIRLSSGSLVYTGKKQKPRVTVTDKKGNVIDSENYQVTYKNNTSVGRASVIVRFRKDYSGQMKKTFDIVPKKVTLSKVTAKSKGFTVKWKRQGTQTTGYEIQYSTGSKFPKKSTKVTTVKNNRTTSRSITKLKAGKRYYVRIRAYKEVKVNGKKIKIYSGWSKIKAVTTGK